MKRLGWIALVGVLWMLGTALWKIYTLPQDAYEITHGC